MNNERFEKVTKDINCLKKRLEIEKRFDQFKTLPDAEFIQIADKIAEVDLTTAELLTEYKQLL